MREQDPKIMDIEARLRAGAVVPAGIALPIVESSAGRLTVSAPSLGGPFRGDFENVRNRLAMAVARHRSRDVADNAGNE